MKQFQDRGISLDILPQRLRGGQALRYFTLNPIAVWEVAVTFVFTGPEHGTDRALRYWAAEHLPLWRQLRSAGVAVHVVVAVRDYPALERYEPTLARWTAGRDPLTEDQRSFLEAIERALRSPDHADLDQWLGRAEAERIAERLRR